MKTQITLLFLFLIGIVSAQKSDSPYLLVNTQEAVIPLKASKTNVEISGPIAHVHITQVYQNLGESAIEAKYVFPMGVTAAVHKMQMRIGERTINAKIFEKNEAKKVYDTALKEGKRAAKLDQERPNVFQMSLGNIMPQDEIAIEIYYTEALVPVNGEYQFVAPGVVGPRFTGENKNSETVFNQAYTDKGSADSFDFDINVNLNAGMTIQHISSSSHNVHINYPNEKSAEVFLSKSDINSANRDFILTYNLRGNAIQSGLLLYEHEDENFFAYVMEPQLSVKLEDIPTREYLFIVDVSGSMNGYPLDVSKELMRNLLCDLRLTDTFNVQLFASSSTMFSPSPVTADTQNIEAAIRFLSDGQGGGGTQLLSALQTAYSLPREDMTSARSMVVITDGYVSVEKEAFQLIENNLDKANVFTFGIGSSVNRYLIEGMAKVANSQSFIATTREEAQIVAKTFKEYIATPVLTQVKLEAQGFEIYDVTPKSIPDVFAARPIVVYGKYKGKAQGKLLFTGYQGNTMFKQEYKVSNGMLSKKNKALRYLWARKRIADLDDYNTLFYEDVKERVVALGLQYNLLSKYTSFVAVDDEIVNKDGSLKAIKQPLPMPQNVSNLAVGAAAEIVSKTKFKNAFKISMDTHMDSSKKRSITIGFKAIYSKWVNTYLEKYEGLRIHFNAEGALVQIEKWENGQWVYSEKMTKDFIRVAKTDLAVNGPLIITVKK